MNVLSVDGGGIRGIIPARVLAHLEERTGRHAADLFDLMAGTSTGGIIVLALTVPGLDGRPRWTANDLVSLYLDEGPRIFEHSIARRLETGLGLLDEKYDAHPLEAALATYLGDAMVSDAVTDVLVTSYDLEHRRPFFFKSDRAREQSSHDWPMRAAARATAGAPTYFEPELLEAEGVTFALCDGGVFANNPAMCAFAEVLRRGAGTPVRLLSLGTGQLTREIHYDQARDWGLIEWARPILDIVFDGVSDAIDYQLDQLLGADGHLRLQVELRDGAKDALDDASEANLMRLDALASELIERSEPQLERFVAGI